MCHCMQIIYSAAFAAMCHPFSNTLATPPACMPLPASQRARRRILRAHRMGSISHAGLHGSKSGEQGRSLHDIMMPTSSLCDPYVEAPLSVTNVGIRLSWPMEFQRARQDQIHAARRKRYRRPQDRAPDTGRNFSEPIGRPDARKVSSHADTKIKTAQPNGTIVDQ